MYTIEQLYPIFRNATGICTDTRSDLSKKLFVALRGDRFDGNDYALQALAGGACAALVDRKDLASHDGCIYVDNTLSALQRLAHYHRNQFDIPVFAITGTNGKTTTKELITAVLSQKFDVCATSGNLNNHIGVPLTLLRITDETECAVVEMGANHAGEIGWLCQIAAPNMGLVTNVFPAHLEGFGSLEVIWKTKMDLYRYLDSRKGLIFINNEEESLGALREIPFTNSLRFQEQNLPSPIKSIQFIEEGDQIRVEILDDEGGMNVCLVSLFGLHNVPNILAAVAVGAQLGLSISEITRGLTAFASKLNRSQVVRRGGWTYYMDAYNANPTSMMLAISFFEKLRAPTKMLLLGDMKELGDETERAHLEILSHVQKISVEKILLVGSAFMAAGSLIEPSSKLIFFTDVQRAKEWLEKQTLMNVHLLVKGSRSLKLESIL